MRPEQRTSTTAAVLFGSALLLVAAIGGSAMAAPAASAQPSDYAQTTTDTESGTGTETTTATDSEPESESETANGTETQSGTESGADEGNLTAETILDDYQQRVNSLETLTLTVRSNATSSSFSSSSTQSIWVDFENERMRVERNSSYGETITVRNESGTVVYNVGENTVSRYNYTFEDRYGTSLGLEPLVNNSEVTYEGTETIDGTEAYRLDVEPETQYGNFSSNVTVWLSTNTTLPVRFEMSADGEYSYEVTQRYTNVTVNETIPADRFTIDIPDDAEQPDYSTPEFYSYDNESVLRANTTQSVPDPSMPANYSFDSGYVTEGDGYDSVTLTYTNNTENLVVSKRNDTGYNYSEHDAFESVAIGNGTGYYNEFDYGETTLSILVWECDGDQYTVYGSLNESETIDVAESIDCG